VLLLLFFSSGVVVLQREGEAGEQENEDP